MGRALVGMGGPIISWGRGQGPSGPIPCCPPAGGAGVGAHSHGHVPVLHTGTQRAMQIAPCWNLDPLLIVPVWAGRAGREARARPAAFPPHPFQMASRSGDREVPPDAAAATEAPADFPCKLERRERPLRAPPIVFLSPVTPALPPQSKQPALPSSGLPLAIWMLGAAAGWRVVLRPIAPARSSPGALVSASEQLGSFLHICI